MSDSPTTKRLGSAQDATSSAARLEDVLKAVGVRVLPDGTPVHESQDRDALELTVTTLKERITDGSIQGDDIVTASSYIVALEGNLEMMRSVAPPPPDGTPELDPPSVAEVGSLLEAFEQSFNPSSSAAADNVQPDTGTPQGETPMDPKTLDLTRKPKDESADAIQPPATPVEPLDADDEEEDDDEDDDDVSREASAPVVPATPLPAVRSLLPTGLGGLGRPRVPAAPLAAKPQTDAPVSDVTSIGTAGKAAAQHIMRRAADAPVPNLSQVVEDANAAVDEEKKESEEKAAQLKAALEAEAERLAAQAAELERARVLAAEEEQRKADEAEAKAKAEAEAEARKVPQLTFAIYENDTLDKRVTVPPRAEILIGTAPECDVQFDAPISIVCASVRVASREDIVITGKGVMSINKASLLKAKLREGDQIRFLTETLMVVFEKLEMVEKGEEEDSRASAPTESLPPPSALPSIPISLSSLEPPVQVSMSLPEVLKPPDARDVPTVIKEPDGQASPSARPITPPGGYTPEERVSKVAALGGFSEPPPRGEQKPFVVKGTAPTDTTKRRRTKKLSVSIGVVVLGLLAVALYVQPSDVSTSSVPTTEPPDLQVSRSPICETVTAENLKAYLGQKDPTAFVNVGGDPAPGEAYLDATGIAAKPSGKRTVYDVRGAKVCRTPAGAVSPICEAVTAENLKAYLGQKDPTAFVNVGGDPAPGEAYLDATGIAAKPSGKRTVYDVRGAKVCHF